MKAFERTLEHSGGKVGIPILRNLSKSLWTKLPNIDRIGRCRNTDALLLKKIFFCWYILIIGSQFAWRRRQWYPTPVLLPGKSHGQRSLVGCSPWGLEESDMTEWLRFHFSLLCIGEGNGNLLQCSCLENPRDGVAQSRTRLKWLSSLLG